MDSNLSSLEEKLKKNDIVDYRICEAIKYHRFRHFHPSVCQQLLIAAGWTNWINHIILSARIIKTFHFLLFLLQEQLTSAWRTDAHKVIASQHISPLNTSRTLDMWRYSSCLSVYAKEKALAVRIQIHVWISSIRLQFLLHLQVSSRIFQSFWISNCLKLYFLCYSSFNRFASRNVLFWLTLLVAVESVCWAAQFQFYRLNNRWRIPPTALPS